MSKICILGDLHFGVKSSSSIMFENTKLFLDEVLFPYLKNNNIKHLIQLGDLVDKRTSIDFIVANRLRTSFLEPLNNMGIETHIIIGNHDCSRRNTLSINALDELIGNRYEHIKIYSSPTDININGLDVLLLPWICADNKELSYSKIKNSKAKFCAGHLELAGYEMYKGVVSSHGEDRDIFKNFSVVVSGHYHHRSSDGQIYYLGTPVQLTWADYNEEKVFSVIDTETLELDFIKNPHILFDKIYYDDTQKYDDLTLYKNKIIKLYVSSEYIRNNKFINLVNKLIEAGAYDIFVIEEVMKIEADISNDIDIETDSTVTIMKKYIDEAVDEDYKESVKDYLISLHNSVANSTII